MRSRAPEVFHRADLLTVPRVLLVSLILLLAAVVEQVCALAEWYGSTFGPRPVNLSLSGGPGPFFRALGRSWVPILLMAIVGALREGCRVIRASATLPAGGQAPDTEEPAAGPVVVQPGTP